jgi:hypothetical protein
MQHTTLNVCGTPACLTNAPGSGHTQVTLPDQAVLIFNPVQQNFTHTWGKDAETVQPAVTPEFKLELLRQLNEHTAQRRARYRRWNAQTAKH